MSAAVEKNRDHFPAPLQLIFSQDGLEPAAGCETAVPAGLVLCSTKQGYSLTLEKSQCLVLSPLEIIFKGKGQKTLDVNLGESARLTLIERHQDAVPQETNLRINLAAQAKLIHGQIITGQNKNVQNISVSVSAEHGAFYDAFTLAAGEVDAVQNMDIKLMGELAEARLLGIHILRGKTKAETNWHVSHMAPHAVSRQIIKNVLDDAAVDSFTGKIYVDRVAQKTDSSQQSRGLLLSDRAEMRARPELEIYADDVKCAHGSTTGDLDEDSMFYLRSRGVPEKEARAILIRAFIDGVVEQIQSDELRASVYLEVKKEMK